MSYPETKSKKPTAIAIDASLVIDGSGVKFLKNIFRLNFDCVIILTTCFERVVTDVMPFKIKVEDIGYSFRVFSSLEEAKAEFEVSYFQN